MLLSKQVLFQANAVMNWMNELNRMERRFSDRGTDFAHVLRTEPGSCAHKDSFDFYFILSFI